MVVVRLGSGIVVCRYCFGITDGVGLSDLHILFEFNDFSHRVS